MEQSLCLLGNLGSSALPPARADGPEGNKMIGSVADQLLANTPTGAKVSELLDGYTLREVSIIPDTIKQWDKKGADDPKVERYFSSHPKIAEQLRAFWKANPPTYDDKSPIPSHHWFHYTDVPLADPLEKYRDGKVGRSQWDIVHMMRYCIAVLQGDEPETNARAITKPISVILLAHLVGDIHHPLHGGAEDFAPRGHPPPPGTPGDARAEDGGPAAPVRRGPDRPWNGPRTIWRRLIVSVDMGAKSYRAKKGEFMRTPATSTRVWVELVPRVKSEVTAPGVPLSTTSRPGTARSRSETRVFPLFSMSRRVMSV